MGIDVYLSWEKQTKKEINKQLESILCIDGGSVGYLREAYHGSIFATHILVPEAFNKPGKEVKISASIMRERLDTAMKAAERRARVTYKESKKNAKRYADQFRLFVELAEKMEKKTKKPVRVFVSF